MYRSTNSLSVDNPYEVLRIAEGEDANLGDFALVAEREGGYIHYVELTLDYLAVGDVDYGLCIRVLARVGVE